MPWGCVCTLNISLLFKSNNIPPTENIKQTNKTERQTTRCRFHFDSNVYTILNNNEYITIVCLLLPLEPEQRSNFAERSFVLYVYPSCGNMLLGDTIGTVINNCLGTI